MELNDFIDTVTGWADSIDSRSLIMRSPSSALEAVEETCKNKGKTLTTGLLVQLLDHYKFVQTLTSDGIDLSTLKEATEYALSHIDDGTKSEGDRETTSDDGGEGEGESTKIKLPKKDCDDGCDSDGKADSEADSEAEDGVERGKPKKEYSLTDEVKINEFMVVYGVPDEIYDSVKKDFMNAGLEVGEMESILKDMMDNKNYDTSNYIETDKIELPTHLNGRKVYPENVKDMFVTDDIMELFSIITMFLEGKLKIKYLNILFYGHAGLGKTHLARAAEDFIFNGTGVFTVVQPTDRESKIFGYSGPTGEFYPTNLLMTLGVGGITVINELGMMDKTIRKNLNPLFDDEGCYETTVINDETGETKTYTYRRCRERIFICTDNLGGKDATDCYDGEAWDISTIDRFFYTLEFKDDPKLLYSICKDRPLVNFIMTWNKACESCDYNRLRISIRGLQRIIGHRACGMKLDKVIRRDILFNHDIGDIWSVVGKCATVSRNIMDNEYYKPIRQIAEEEYNGRHKYN